MSSFIQDWDSQTCPDHDLLSHETSTLFPLCVFVPLGFHTKVLIRDVFMVSKLNHAVWLSLMGSIDEGYERDKRMDLRNKTGLEKFFRNIVELVNLNSQEAPNSWRVRRQVG